MYLKGLAFGGYCPLCGTPSGAFVDTDICEACRSDITTICDRKYLLFGTNHCRALYEYNGVIAEGLLKFKFSCDRAIGDMFGFKLTEFITSVPEFDLYDHVVSIPNNPYPSERRVFNQSEYLARILAANTKRKFIRHAMIKRPGVKSQIECRTYAERRENIINAFYVRNSRRIKGKRIIIIDDICTTGATLEEAARVLREAGAKEIAACVVAKASGEARIKDMGVVQYPLFKEDTRFYEKDGENDYDFENVDVRSRIIVKDSDEIRDTMRAMLDDADIVNMPSGTEQ